MVRLWLTPRCGLFDGNDARCDQISYEEMLMVNDAVQLYITRSDAIADWSVDKIMSLIEATRTGKHHFDRAVLDRIARALFEGLFTVEREGKEKQARDSWDRVEDPQEDRNERKQRGRFRRLE